MVSNETCDVAGQILPKIISCLVFLMASITFTGNAILCYGLLTRKHLRTNMNCFVLCLSATDILSAVFQQPLDALYFAYYPTYPFAPETTMFWNTMFFTQMSGTGYFLTAMMADRVVAVRHALRYHKIMRKRTVRFVIVIGCVYASTVFFTLLLAQDRPPRDYYAIIIQHDLYHTVVVLSVILPLCCTSTMAVYLTKLARQHRATTFKPKSTTHNDRPHSSTALAVVAAPLSSTLNQKLQRLRHENGLRKELKLFKLVIILALSLVLSWLPFLISMLLHMFGHVDLSCHMEFIATVFGWMTYWTTWSLLLVFVTGNRELRQVYRKILCRKSRHKISPK